MNINEIKEKLNADEYRFLKENKHLGNNIILLALGGSNAYGTNVDGSDIDIRGCALNSKTEILTGQNFEQVTDNPTDTVIYSFRKFVSLLCACNPNIIETLGCKPEHYLRISKTGQMLIDNSHMFLSKIAATSFGEYASAQLRRLENKTGISKSPEKIQRNILNSINNARKTFHKKYSAVGEDAINLYVGKSSREDAESEIFMNISLMHYPLRDLTGMLSEMQNIAKSYSSLGKRNKNAVEHDKIGKHMMHLIRLYMMCLDILENEKIVTYREKEHDFLMDIRNGKYLDQNENPTAEFFEILNEYEKKLEYAKKNTSLPDKPDYDRINEFVADVNENVVLDLLPEDQSLPKPCIPNSFRQKLHAENGGYFVP